MEYFYWVVIIIFLLSFFKFAIKFPRKGVIVGLTITTFTLEAFPWHLIPLDHIAFFTPVLFISMALIVFFLRDKQNIRIHILFSHYLLILLVFLLTMICYLTISPNQTYGLQKCLIFVIKVIFPLFAFALLSPFDKKDIKVFITSIIMGSLLTSLNLYAYGNIHLERGVIDNFSSPITMSRVIGLGATLILVLFGTKKYANRQISIVKYFFSIIIFCFMIFSMLLTGSRGPLLFVFIAFFFTLPLIIKQMQLKFLKTAIISMSIIFLIAVVSSAILDINNTQFASVERIMRNFTTLGQNRSDQGRINLYIEAVDNFIDTEGSGVGTGGFSYYFGVTKYTYPHNLFLEVASEQGIIGLLILLILLGTVVIQLNKLIKSKNPYITCLLAIWLFTLFNSLVSMDISGNYYFWIIGGLFWLMKTGGQQKSKTRKLLYNKEKRTAYANDLSPSV